MRTLTEKEVKQVAGGCGSSCYNPCGCDGKMRGNPGNYKPVGNAGEKGGKFTAGYDTRNGNGRAGASAA